MSLGWGDVDATTEREFRDSAGAIGDRLSDEPPEARASRTAVELVGRTGLIAARWRRSDDLFGVALIEELALRGLTSTAVVVSLHVESVLAMLRQFAREQLRSMTDAALLGEMIGCVAASEPGGGSDLAAVEASATRVSAGWRIEGEKKFVTLADQADFAVVLARVSGSRDGELGVFVVPRGGYEILRTHRLVAGSHLETSWLRIDATVPSHHLLARPGLGLAVLNWGLTKERLAVAALAVGTCRLALSLATTHAMQRSQFGARLIDHQALRLRLADLHAQLHPLASDLRHLASAPASARRVAGLKVTAARFAERCVSECMHIFGGDGYLEDATPLGRLWRDIRLARIGGGTDEMMWEIVASGLTGDPPTYRRHISRNGQHNDHRIEEDA